MAVTENTGSPEAIGNIIASEEQRTEIIDSDEYYDAEVDYLLKHQIIDTLKANNDHRRRYAMRTFVLTCIWIFLVFVLVAAKGLRWKGESIIHLSDTIIITLITTTTLNVFGFFLLVMKYLFNTAELKELKDLFGDK